MPLAVSLAATGPADTVALHFQRDETWLPELSVGRSIARDVLITLEDFAFTTMNTRKPVARTIAVLVGARNVLVAVRIRERYLRLFKLPTNTKMYARLVLLFG